MYDVIIIGAGPGGITAAVYASRAGLSVALIEKGPYGGQLNNTDTIENYTGFTSVSGFELAQRMEEQAKALDKVDHLYGDVLSVEKDTTGFTVLMGDRLVKSKAVIAATGVQHKKLNIPGEEAYEGLGVSYCSVCDGAFFKDRDVAVIGGGDSAAEAALYLANIAKQVTLVHRRGELRAEQILQDRLAKKDNISITWHAQTFGIVGNGMVSGVEYVDSQTAKISTLNVEGVFIYIGIDPTTKLFEDLGVLTDEGYIDTNERMETAVEGFYAIGDVREGSSRQVVSATGDAAVASESLTAYLQRIEG